MHPSRQLLAGVKKTALNAWHIKNGGKMVEFCGWDMPVMYKVGVLGEHFICRKGAAIFDVGHMGQLKFTGKDRHAFIEKLTPVSMNIPVGQSKLSVITTPEGGCIDDTMITRQEDHVWEVVNAGCADKDIQWFRDQIKAFKGDVQLEFQDKSLIALQGPGAMAVLQKLVGSSEDLSKMPFMTARNMKVGSIQAYVSRCGYTGEDGFEVSIEHKDAEKVADMFLEQGAGPCGLGSRDSLRLEAGLCLYGHELNETISPIEAGLAWLIPKERRQSGGFYGSDRILKELKDGVKKKRVGLFVTGAPAREQSKICSESGAEIGIVTSGGPSPCLKKNVAIAYINTAAKKGLNSTVQVEVRGKLQNAVVTKLPFVQTGYFRVK